MIEGDEELCIGCRTCELVCSLSLFEESNPQKSAIRIFTNDGDYTITVCNQCGECEPVCPEGAIFRENGIVRINENRCTGCYICVDACPLKALFIHEELIEPFKCIECKECVESCPINALEVLDLEF